MQWETKSFLGITEILKGLGKVRESAAFIISFCSESALVENDIHI